MKNTGSVAGAETAQLYLNDEQARVDRPVKELKVFEKIALRPGQKRRIAWTLDQTALSFYDVDRKRWVAEPGRFNVWIGSSSRDIRLRDTFELE